MTDLVHYHHPGDEQYSLAYVTLDVDEINPNDGKVETYYLDKPVHVLFTNSGASGTIDDISGELKTKLEALTL